MAAPRLEVALALGYAERVVREREQFWVPPARIAYDSTLRGALFDTWRQEYGAQAMQSDPCAMAALTNPPRLDEVEAHLKAIESRWH